MNKGIYLFILSISLISCGIKKTVKKDFLKLPKNPTEIIERVKSTNKYPDFLSLKGKLLLVNKDQEIALNINIKNRKDSVIWVSLSVSLGIEIIRAQITPDSIYFINRSNKTYLVKTSSYIKELINLDLSFYDLQDIITANPKILNEKYKIKSNSIDFSLYTDDYNYVISNKYRVQKINIKDEKHRMEFRFSDFKEDISFPAQVFLKKTNQETIEITINYSKIEFNNPKKIIFQIPNSYERIQ
tara:strand:- start:796 stop:1524 length:729 start_codon:yes stop_codon:yes gene_type:complete